MKHDAREPMRSLAPSLIDDETGRPARSNKALFVIVVVGLVVVGGGMLLGMKLMQGAAPVDDCEPPACVKE